MSYEPKLRPNARDKISDYLEATYRSRQAFLLAVEEVRMALLRLAPTLGKVSARPDCSKPARYFGLSSKPTASDGSSKSAFAMTPMTVARGPF